MNFGGSAMKPEGQTAFRHAQVWAGGAMHPKDSIKAPLPTLL